MWKSIVGAWLNVRLGLIKSDPSNLDEILRQPLFGNLSILNARGTLLGVGGVSEGNAFAQSGYSRVKDIWNVEAKDWKGLTDLGMKHHPANRRGMETITTSIPWRLSEHEGLIRAGDWLANSSPRASNPLEWVYLVLEQTGDIASVLEFQRITHEGRIQATTNQATRILTTKLLPVRVLSQERLEATLKIAREPPAQGKAPLLYWIFDEGFIRDLPWDPGEWHWQAIPPLGDAPFFGYPAKRGYANIRKSNHKSSMKTFLDDLNFRNTSSAQMTARIWHNARPRKVGTLIWLILNKGFLVGSWLQQIGLPSQCKVYVSNLEESAQHLFLNCLMARNA